jgi:type VI secretion system protein ImpL
MLHMIRSRLLSPIGLLILFSLILAATLWYLGPLLAFGDVRPLDGLAERLIAMGAIAAITTIAILVILLRRRALDRTMTEAMTTQATSPETRDSDMVEAELSDLSARMTEALGILRGPKLGGRFGSRPLYQLPWYIIIGPPGSGKTTAIINSGLRFPLAERMGKTAVSGVGGTRDCDWWFTDEAVLLDTAGRYTTQDSNKGVDAKTWTGFLDILKKYRRRQPINGAVVAISLSDLSTQDERERQAHAKAIRTRLLELRERLGVRFPVYILFTKTDLIAGFQEFFENLGAEERQQVWGFTFPLDPSNGGAPPLASFTTEFTALVDQLSSLSLERMQAEIDFQRRSLIAGFPAQFASLRGLAESLLGDIFQENRYEEGQLLRGVYFTSGTQEGTPIDRLMLGMSKTFGIGRQAIGTGRGQGRSFFLTRLLTGVIFKESGLVSADDAVERRYRWIKRGTIAAGVLIFSTAIGLWTNSYLGNLDLIADARSQVETFRDLSRDIPTSPIADDNLPAVVPALNALRDLPGNPSADDPAPPLALTYGLYQGDAVGTEGAQAYRGALNAMLLPRLLIRLETQMQANLNNKAFLFEALRVYLILGLQAPMDVETVSQWMGTDWGLAFPGRDHDQLRADLARHLDAMLTQPMRRIDLNGPLIAQVRGLLLETPLADRIYQGIVTAPSARALPPFRITDVGGPAVARVMTRPSGKPLSDGIDGIYTYEGFHAYFLPRLSTVEDQAKQENLVLGPAAAPATPEALDRLERDILALYENDYVTRYDQLLVDLDIVPMESLGQARDAINTLSGPASPILNILTAVSRETKLTQLPGEQEVAKNVGGAATGILRDEAVSSLNSQQADIVEALSSAIPAESLASRDAPPPGQFVESRFQSLHDLVDGVQGAPSQLDDVLRQMNDVFNQLNRLSLGQNTGTAIVSQGASAADQLQATIARLPNPLRRWTSQVVDSSSGATVGGARAELNTKWQAGVLSFCQKALSGRYPFDRRAQADVTPRDFGRLFAPDGLIDSFFKENLAPFVDTASNPWRLKQVNGADIGISNAVIAQFQKAADIRDSFFLSSGLPSITFDIKPLSLDATVDNVVLEVDGERVTYAHGPPEVTQLTWPGKAGGRTRVALTPTRPDVANSIQRDGPWAWFRLLDAAESRRTNVSDRSEIVFNLGGRIASFQLRAGSALNPFTLPALKSFSCPRSL